MTVFSTNTRATPKRDTVTVEFGSIPNGHLTQTTEQDFIAHEKYVWGDDYVIELLESGYTVELIDGKWTWALSAVK